MMSQKLIILAGLPGSGKSTLAEGLCRHFSLPLFSIDPIEAAMRRGGLPRNDTGIAAYVVAQALAEEHLRLGQAAVIDAVNPVEAPRAAWRNQDIARISRSSNASASTRRRIAGGSKRESAASRAWPRSPGKGSKSDARNMKPGPMRG